MSRGNAKMPIFLDDTDYRQFVYLLGDVVEEFNIECLNYCGMPNHYHATLRPREPNFSDAMRRFNGNYALWWNKRHERVGHTFQGRFKDQIVQREGYLLTLTRYVVRNPVRARLVERPEDWPWSSYRATAGLDSAPPFLAVSATLALFGEADDHMLRRRFVEYVTGNDVDPTLEDRIRSNERVLGDKAFKKVIRDAPKVDRSDALDPSAMPTDTTGETAPADPNLDRERKIGAGPHTTIIESQT